MAIIFKSLFIGLFHVVRSLGVVGRVSAFEPGSPGYRKCQSISIELNIVTYTTEVLTKR